MNFEHITINLNFYITQFFLDSWTNISLFLNLELTVFSSMNCCRNFHWMGRCTSKRKKMIKFNYINIRSSQRNLRKIMYCFFCYKDYYHFVCLPLMFLNFNYKETTHIIIFRMTKLYVNYPIHWNPIDCMVSCNPSQNRREHTGDSLASTNCPP